MHTVYVSLLYCIRVRVESLVAHARRWLPCVRVKWSKQPKRRPEWRMARSGNLRSFVDAMCSTACGAPQLESSYILCKREASNTNDLYVVAVICVGARVYMRAHTYSLRAYAQIIIGENLIWRFCDRSPNRQIKALAKISRYTVHGSALVSFPVPPPGSPLLPLVFLATRLVQPLASFPDHRTVVRYGRGVELKRAAR